MIQPNSDQEGETRFCPPQITVSEDFCPQSSLSFQHLLCSARKRKIHPITGTTFFLSQKTNALNLKFDTDQIVQSNPPGDHVPAVNCRSSIPDVQLRTKVFMNFQLEECDLPLVVVSIPEKAVTENPFAGKAPDLRHFRHGVGTRWFLVMAKKAMPFRNKQAANLEIGKKHDGNDNSTSIGSKTGF
jgi:hypothetical protein